MLYCNIVRKVYTLHTGKCVQNIRFIITSKSVSFYGHQESVILYTFCYALSANFSQSVVPSVKLCNNYILKSIFLIKHNSIL